MPELSIAGLRSGQVIITEDGRRWRVEGTSRYAPGRSVNGRREPGITLRPEGGGRARTVGQGFLWRAKLSTPCGFCGGKPVGNAAAWIDPKAPATAPCPRCGP